VKHASTSLLNVFLDGRQRRKIGRLATQGRRILFEYDPAFLAADLEISPFQLSARPGVAAGDASVFDGLFGVFNDSLPDGWGRLLLDRAVENLGIARVSLTPLDRLAHVGRHGMGALSYEPDLSDSDRAPAILQLDRLAQEAATVLAGEEGPVIEKLLKLNGGSAGARPKIVAQISADRKNIVHGPASLPKGYAHWMIKFPATSDPGDVGYASLRCEEEEIFRDQAIRPRRRPAHSHAQPLRAHPCRSPRLFARLRHLPESHPSPDQACHRA
jgi:serine/threonine-protein kinase HipA